MNLKNGQFLVIFEVKIGHFRGSFLTRKIQLSVIKMKFLLIIAQNKAGDVLYRSPTRKRGENIAFHAIFCRTWIKFRVHVKEPVLLTGVNTTTNHYNNLILLLFTDYKFYVLTISLKNGKRLAILLKHRLNSHNFKHNNNLI